MNKESKEKLGSLAELKLSSLDEYELALSKFEKERSIQKKKFKTAKVVVGISTVAMISSLFIGDENLRRSTLGALDLVIAGNFVIQYASSFKFSISKRANDLFSDVLNKANKYLCELKSEDINSIKHKNNENKKAIDIIKNDLKKIWLKSSISLSSGVGVAFLSMLADKSNKMTITSSVILVSGLMLGMYGLNKLEELVNKDNKQKEGILAFTDNHVKNKTTGKLTFK